MKARRRVIAALMVATIGNAAVVVSILALTGGIGRAVAQMQEVMPGAVDLADVPEAVDVGRTKGSTDLTAAEARETYLALIDDLATRRDAIQLAERDLDERERQIEIVREELSIELARIEQIRTEAAAERAKLMEMTSPSFDRLLKAYEGMEPSNAANALIEIYDRDRLVVVDLLLGMRVRQAAAALDALAAVSPQTAAELSLEIWREDPERGKRVTLP